jgi:hypothetical protein
VVRLQQEYNDMITSFENKRKYQNKIDKCIARLELKQRERSLTKHEQTKLNMVYEPNYVHLILKDDSQSSSP